MKRILSLLGAGGLALLVVDSSLADVFATNPTGGWSDVSITRTLGTPFGVGNEGVTVTALGFFDKDGNGLSVAHEVGLFATDQTLLGKVTIPSGTGAALHDGTRWLTLASPIILAPNTEYMLATTLIEGEDQLNAATPVEVSINAKFHLTQSGYAEGFGGAALVYPGDPTSRAFYGFGANLETVPEPGVGALLALGLVALHLRRRRVAKHGAAKFSSLASLALLLSVFSAAAQQYGIMPYSEARLRQWQAERAAMPVYQAPSGYPGLQGSVNLLTYLNYNGKDRDQGHTGTCWIWGCQAVMSIDYAIKNPDAPVMTNGFSVQFLASNLELVDTSLMEGGTPNTVARFYEAMSFAIPWSNTNAAWTDLSGWNKTPAAWIHSQPNHPLAAVYVSDVATFGLPEAQAIANLKSALDTGHPLWFNMTLADEQDWDIFFTFWGKTNANEETIINLDYGDGHFLYPSGGSHIVACVGYNDVDPDPAKHYWIMLNSWGTGEGRRPQGLFRLAMHMKYSAVVKPSMGDDAPMFTWGMLDTEFTTKVRKGIGALALNLQTRDPAASAFRVSRVSFPPASAPTNVYAAYLELNGRYFPCNPDKGNWTHDTNGFHYLTRSGETPAIQMDIDPVSCTWSLAATNVSAEESRYLDSRHSIYFIAHCKQAADSEQQLQLGNLRAVAFDEMATAEAGEYSSPPPDAPSLALRLTGTQGVLRISGETGRTCAVQETDALGTDWFLRALVPMTQPVEEVALPAPTGTNRFWRVKVQ